MFVFRSWAIAVKSSLFFENACPFCNLDNADDLITRNSVLKKVNEPCFMNRLLFLYPDLPRKEVKFLDNLYIGSLDHLSKDVRHCDFCLKKPVPCANKITRLHHR